MTTEYPVEPVISRHHYVKIVKDPHISRYNYLPYAVFIPTERRLWWSDSRGIKVQLSNLE